jgi:hypothetical protein
MMGHSGQPLDDKVGVTLTQLARLMDPSAREKLNIVMPQLAICFP